ncbi:MAG: hypothetical protein US76_04240 [Parcubacteria group bacterium GW2011_GWA2_38_13b]|nr:MAG: hypothetical protein US76_04240 [Parcubacteria group bacterium GW2011_GWA2_38_13b]
MNNEKNYMEPEPAKILKILSLGEYEKLFRLELKSEKKLGHKPLQFVKVSIPLIGEAPISVCNWQEEFFEIAVRKVGDVTNKIHTMETGETIGITGPLGNGFPIDEMRGKDLLVIAGGIGLFPARSLIHYSLANHDNFGRIIILFGTKSFDERYFPEELLNWQYRGDLELHQALDKGDARWGGHIGLITTLIPPVQINAENTCAVIVGPPIMYRFVIPELRKKNIPDTQILMSFERRMECGAGKCGRCQINGPKTTWYTCKDGPVISYADVLRLKLKEAI